ncbi:MAG: Bax inhibitor-1/YccA family protein [Candidatus Zixiibacteriota bacterium]
MATTTVPDYQIALEQQRFMTRVYGWMALALGVTGALAFWIATIPQLIELVVGNRFAFIVIILAELGMVYWLTSRIEKMSAQTATVLFLAYAAANGITFSVIFLQFTMSSIGTTFLVCGGTFGATSLYGYTTRRDLTGVGGFAIMGLFGLMIATIVNMFWRNETFYWATTYLGVLIFVLLTAWDTQKIKASNIIGNEGTEADRKEAIIGALRLYLDFINLFLMLLRLFGRRR